MSLPPLKPQLLEEDPKTLSQKIEDWIEQTHDWFHVKEIDKELGLVSPNELNNRKQKIHTLYKSNKLRKHRNRLGYYRRLSPVKPMQWWDAPMEPVDIVLPFGLSDPNSNVNAKIFNGNFIICATPSNHGKTLLAYNFIEDNLDSNPYNNKPNLVVSEQDESEVRYVLEKNDYYRHELWKDAVNIMPKQGDWADMLQPDAINILDYVSDYSEAWGIGEQLRDIYDAMYGQRGVIWINLQKDSYEDPRTGKTVYKSMARGGSVTMDIARLYLSVTPIHEELSIVEIKKGKFGGAINPTGFKKRFTITGDGAILERGIWSRGKE